MPIVMPSPRLPLSPRTRAAGSCCRFHSLPIGASISPKDAGTIVLEARPIAGIEAQGFGRELAFDGRAAGGLGGDVERSGGSDWVGSHLTFGGPVWRRLHLRHSTFD
jgi:hypothetical protein